MYDKIYFKANYIIDRYLPLNLSLEENISFKQNLGLLLV